MPILSIFILYTHTGTLGEDRDRQETGRDIGQICLTFSLFE